MPHSSRHPQTIHIKGLKRSRKLLKTIARIIHIDNTTDAEQPKKELEWNQERISHIKFNVQMSGDYAQDAGITGGKSSVKRVCVCVLEDKALYINNLIYWNNNRICHLKNKTMALNTIWQEDPSHPKII